MKTLEEIKNFVDIPEGWKITEKVKKSQHHPDCSWVKAKMLCDCGVLDGAIEMRKMDYKLFKSTISQTKQELIEDKNARDNRIHKEGFDAGYKKGYKEGYKEGTLETIRYSLLNSLEGHSGKGEA